MTRVFFYGLFMDDALLRDKGFNPSTPVIAYVADYGLRIGQRATLVPAAGERAYGTVMALADEELAALYSEHSVADYVAEPVTAMTLDNEPVDAIAYNLPADKLSGRNDGYLRSLVAIARKTGLPENYINHLDKLANET